jgi:hypothetical protein
MHLTRQSQSRPLKPDNISNWLRIEQKRMRERELKRQQRFKTKPKN